MRVCEDNYGVLRRAEDLLKNDFSINITNDDEIKGYIDEDDVVEMIDELCSEIDSLREQLEEQKEHYENLIEDCYKPISPYEYYGVSEHELY